MTRLVSVLTSSSPDDDMERIGSDIFARLRAERSSCSKGLQLAPLSLHSYSSCPAFASGSSAAAAGSAS